MRVFIILSLCLIGAFVGYRLGWGSALASPEIEEAFTFSSPVRRSATAAAAPVERLDSHTAMTTTLPAAMRAMRKKDYAAFQKHLKDLETLSAGQLEDMLRETDPEEPIFQGLFELLVRADPAHAFRWIDELLPDGSSDRFKRIGFSRWCAADPKGAWEALQSPDFPRWQSTPGSIESDVLKHWAKEDLRGALSEWSSLTEEDQGNAFGGIARAFARNPETRERLFEYLGEQPKNKGRQWATGILLQNWVREEGLQAPAEWLTEHSEDHAADDIADFEGKIAMTSVGTDPETTIAWLMERSDPQRRSTDLYWLVLGWAILEPSATGEWLATLELGPDTDRAVAQFAKTIARDDPESAHAWSQQITDQSTRDQTSRSVLRTWREVDPKGASAVVE